MYRKKQTIKKLEIGQTVLGSIFMFAIGVLAATVIWYALFEKSPLTYRNLPFEVINQPIKPGEKVSLIVNRCNTSGSVTNYVITRYLQSVDGENLSIILGSTEVVMEPGCVESISLSNTLPVGTKPGKYRIIGKAEVRGTIKVFYVDWHTKPFEVK